MCPEYDTNILQHKHFVFFENRLVTQCIFTGFESNTQQPYEDNLISYICQTYHSQPRHLRDLKPAGKTSWLSKSKGCEKKVLNIHKRVQAKKVYRLQSKNTQHTVYPDVCLSSTSETSDHHPQKKNFLSSLTSQEPENI